MDFEKKDLRFAKMSEKSDKEEIKMSQSIGRSKFNKEEYIKKIQGMYDSQLLKEIMDNSDMGEYILPFVGNLSKFYDKLDEEYLSAEEVCSDSEAHLHNWIPILLRQIKRYVADLGYTDFEEYEMDIEEGLEEDNPEYIDALLEKEMKSKEARDAGFEINEYGEIIRSNNTKTPLQQKEEELSSLEEEEKKISKTEAIIKKEMDKKGKGIGE